MSDFPRVPSNSTIVFDVETDGLDWKRNRVVGYVVGLGPKKEDCRYYPVRHAAGGNMGHAPVLKWLKDIAKDSTIRIVGHNLKFDLHFAENEGLIFEGPVECTMVNAALIDENLFSYSLAALSNAYGVPTPKKTDIIYQKLAAKFGGAPDKKQMANFHKLAGDDPDVVAYAVSDAVSTWHLHQMQQELIARDKLEVVHGVECRVLRTLQRMERFGVPIDEDRARKLKKQLEAKLIELAKELPPGMNVRSPKQLKAWFSSLGVSGWPQTDKGNASFPEQWLMTHEPGQRIVTVRKASNMINSFLEPLLSEHLYKGRVHTTFNQCRMDEFGVVTGRLSSSDPNMQQIPKRDKILAPLFRSIFIPPKGSKWSANDYNQQEFRVFADYSQSSMLLEGYRKSPPEDIHSLVAKLLGVERDPTAKRMNLGMLYGMGVVKLAASLGIDEKKAKWYRNEYDQVLPEARRFLKSAEQAARQRGWVRTKLGRRRRFPDLSAAHKAGNAVIQGTSADITKLKMVEIDDYFRSSKSECRLMLQVHDELDWFVPKGESKTNFHAVSIMESFKGNDLIKMSVPMMVESSLGDSWSQATFKK